MKCPECNGAGTVKVENVYPWKNEGYRKCSNCHGTGKVKGEKPKPCPVDEGANCVVCDNECEKPEGIEVIQAELLNDLTDILNEEKVLNPEDKILIIAKFSGSLEKWFKHTTPGCKSNSIVNGLLDIMEKDGSGERSI